MFCQRIYHIPPANLRIIKSCPVIILVSKLALYLLVIIKIIIISSCYNLTFSKWIIIVTLRYINCCRAAATFQRSTYIAQMIRQVIMIYIICPIPLGIALRIVDNINSTIIVFDTTYIIPGRGNNVGRYADLGNFLKFGPCCVI